MIVTNRSTAWHATMLPINMPITMVARKPGTSNSTGHKTVTMCSSSAVKQLSS